MLRENRHWSSGNWQVTDGKAEEFMERWREFLGWTKAANEGFLSARLIRDLADGNHFVSVASWQDADSMLEWRDKPEFAELFGNCRALCDDMQSGAYELAVDV